MRRVHPGIVALAALLICVGTSAAQPAAAREGAISRSADPTALRQVALGVATPDGRSLGALDRFSAKIGRRPAIWAIWSQWGLPTARDFPTRIANGLAARGVMPMIWWEPIDPRSPRSPAYARHRNITAGRHDAYIRRFALDAKAFGRTVLLRFAQEANGREFPWGTDRFDNDAQTFVAAWRHVHDVFQRAGATNVKFVWSVAKQRCKGCNPYRATYPGDAYVDIVGFTAYNWGARKGRWISLYTSAAQTAHQLRAVSSKPLIIAESGCNAVGGSKAAWFRQGFPEVYERLPEIEAIVYLNADLRSAGDADWRIASPRKALSAYAAVAGLDKFAGRSVP